MVRDLDLLPLKGNHMPDTRPITPVAFDLPGERYGRNAAVWLLCEAILMDTGKVPSVAQVRAAGVAAGFNEGNCEAEYARWKANHARAAV